MEELMAKTGVELPKYQDNGSWFLPVPGTFVIATDGTVAAARHFDPDCRRRFEHASDSDFDVAVLQRLDDRFGRPAAILSWMPGKARTARRMPTSSARC
jgi:hypothetical protein